VRRLTTRKRKSIRATSGTVRGASATDRGDRRGDYRGQITLCQNWPAHELERTRNRPFKKKLRLKTCVLAGTKTDFGELSAALQGLDAPQRSKKPAGALHGDFKAGK